MSQAPANAANRPAEFDVIQRYFVRPSTDAQVLLGVGDDCALLQPRAGEALAISTDSLVVGVHFFPDVAPRALGHKALAVNLSDLAAMGAEPIGCTLALTLAHIDATWLQEFAAGLWALADAHHCPLIGGDTTQGPLHIGITVLGQVPLGQALTRRGAQVGDDIYISGTAMEGVGQAACGLALQRGQLQLPAELAALAQRRLERPTPRLALGRALRGVAHAAIDVSDGLLSDLQHILRASGVGAMLRFTALERLAQQAVLGAVERNAALRMVCDGGDDYELLVTAAPQAQEAVMAAAQRSGCYLIHIGQVVAGSGILLRNDAGQVAAVSGAGYEHFRF